MARKKVKQFDKMKVMLVGVVIGLTGIVVTISAVQMAYVKMHRQNESAKSRVSLGAMRYDFSTGEAVKRNDETVKSLKAFLISLAEKDDQHDCKARYQVVKASSDEKQVLLKYGCHYPSASMFAVNEDGSWRTISPTNQFDELGVPACEHVNENKIDKSLAPVCVNGLGDNNDQVLTYSVR